MNINDMTKIIFKVDPVKGMCVTFEFADGQFTRVVEQCDFRMVDIVILAKNPVAIHQASEPMLEHLELVQEKPQAEIDKMFEIFKS